MARPEEGYPIVHVAGTNGKTSTTRMIAALVEAHGLTVGSFTSPELEAVEDHFEYGGHSMTPEEFAVAVTELEPIVRMVEHASGDGVTPFEMLTAMAFAWFAERSVDLAVVEAGLGGRDDATNAARSDVAVVTRVALDHTEHLGPTVEEVAAHKLGILDQGASLVTGPLDPAVEDLAGRRAEEQGALWFRFGTEYRPDDVQRAVAGWVFDVDGIHGRYTEVGLRLRGRHQVENFAVAVAAAEALLGRSLDEAAVREVAATLAVPGRMEVVGSDPLVLLDSAHNPDGAVALAAALDEEHPTTRWAVVLGVMADKDVDGILDALRPVAASVVTTAARTPRALSADDLAVRVRDALDVPVVSSGSVAEAMAIARRPAAPVLVTGSVAVVGEARRILRSK